MRSFGFVRVPSGPHCLTTGLGLEVIGVTVEA